MTTAHDTDVRRGRNERFVIIPKAEYLVVVVEVMAQRYQCMYICTLDMCGAGHGKVPKYVHTCAAEWLSY